MATARTLVLGAAKGYAWPRLAPFARSLRAAGCAARVALLAADLAPGAAQELGRLGVELLPLDPGPATATHILRYRGYLRFLEERGERFDMVMLSDVRDVIFQSDPFSRLDGGLHLFLEDRRMRVGTCPWTSRWVRSRLGEAALAEVADRPLSCSGVVMGETSRVVGYLEAMLPLLFPLDESMPGYDQGVHNHLLHTGRLPSPDDVRLHPAESGPVMTCSYLDWGDASLAEGLILNPAGLVPAVVHQYDRLPALARHVRQAHGER